MRRRIIIFAIISLSLGIIVTTLFASLSSVKDFGDCANSYNQTLPQSIRRVDCSGYSYGFPYKFIQSEPSLEIGYLTEPYTSPTVLGVTGRTKVDTGKLALNLLFWSAISGAVAGTAVYQVSHRKDKKPDPAKAKK